MKRVLIPLFCALFLCTSNAYAKEKLIWFIWDLPPEFIKSGKWANQGYGDKFLKYFMDRMPNYDHKIQRVNIPRWGTEVLKPNRCSAHLWGGFFPDQLILSKPYSFTPPHVLIFPKHMEREIGPAGSSVAIQDLLKNDDLKLMVQRINFNNDAKQSRYPVLYPWLKPYLGQKNLIELSGGRNDIDLRLLNRGRADYTIGYPTTVTTQKRVYGIEGEFVTYNIREHFIFKNIYVACKNTDFGHKVIQRVNEIITYDALKTFLSYHEEWNNNDPYFRQVYHDYFFNKTGPGNVLD